MVDRRIDSSAIAPASFCGPAPYESTKLDDQKYMKLLGQSQPKRLASVISALFLCLSFALGGCGGGGGGTSGSPPSTTSSGGGSGGTQASNSNSPPPPPLPPPLHRLAIFRLLPPARQAPSPRTLLWVSVASQRLSLTGRSIHGPQAFCQGRRLPTNGG